MMYGSPSTLTPRIVRAVALLGLIALFLSCTSTVDYTYFKESRPRSILVMPPVNLSPDLGGESTFLATSIKPLAESGYYVIPPALSDTMFKENGITSAEEAWDIPLERLYEIYGADAALYITILRYGVIYVVLNSVVVAEAEAVLVDLRTGERLWKGHISDSTSSDNSNNSLLGALISAAVDQAVNTLSNRAFDLGRSVNYQLLEAGRINGILYGPYHSKYTTE